MDTLEVLLRSALLHVLLPVWVLAGFGDWLVHRLEHIERTAGLKEALIHLLMLIELGPCLVAVLLLEVNALVLAGLALAALAHEVTVWWDLRYAMRCRRISVLEQWLHSFQTVLPWVALACLFLLHWPQALSLIGLGSQAPDWSLRWKEPALAGPAIGISLALGAFFIAGPFLEEAWRCWRARRPVGR